MSDRPTVNDYVYNEKLKIPPTIHTGLKWTDNHGHECTSYISESRYKNGKRIAQLVEHTFVGTAAIGGMHWYASIRVDSPSVKCLEGGGKEHIYFSGGYGPDKPEQFLESIRIDATRKLLKAEKDMNGDRICKVGESTYRFNSEASARAAAIKTFNRKFEPGWILLPDSYIDEEVTISET